jgi:hypothetical protein
MAIKVSGTIVLDNSQNIANANTLVFTGNSHVKLPSGTTEQRPGSPQSGMIRYNTSNSIFESYTGSAWEEIGSQYDIVATPTNVDPANGAVEVTQTNPVLEGSPYYHVYGKAKANGQWQISNTSNFSTTVVDAVVSGNSVTYTTSVTLPVGTHYWRVRYQDSDGVWSNYSTATQFFAGSPPPSVLGASYNGGFYTGVINVSGTCYYLIVSPNATGCACCQWKTTRTITSGTESCVAGYTNTYGPMDNADHPAGNWTATRTIGGYSDWYLPSRDETGLMNTNKVSMPSGEGFASGGYWSSSQIFFTNAPNSAILRDFSSGTAPGTFKTETCKVRAVRREPV